MTRKRMVVGIVLLLSLVVASPAASVVADDLGASGPVDLANAQEEGEEAGEAETAEADRARETGLRRALIDPGTFPLQCRTTPQPLRRPPKRRATTPSRSPHPFHVWPTRRSGP